jgi:hypothetical protein
MVARGMPVNRNFGYFPVGLFQSIMNLQSSSGFIGILRFFLLVYFDE